MMLLKMKSGYGWTTPSGVHFSELHPFGLVEDHEIPSLLETERFEIATKEELRKFYKVEIPDGGK